MKACCKLSRYSGTCVNIITFAKYIQEMNGNPLKTIKAGNRLESYCQLKYIRNVSEYISRIAKVNENRVIFHFLFIFLSDIDGLAFCL